MEINLLKIGDITALNNHPDCPHQQNKREGKKLYEFDEICKFCFFKFVQKLPKDQSNRVRTIVKHHRKCEVLTEFLNRAITLEDYDLLSTDPKIVCHDEICGFCNIGPYIGPNLTLVY